MLSFLIRCFSRAYMVIERRRTSVKRLADQPVQFEYDTNYPFF